MINENTAEYITRVINSRYTREGHIKCEIQFSGETDNDNPVYTPYLACASDSVDFGRTLFNDLQAGKYGEVAPFTVSPEMLDALKAEKRDQINVWRAQQENCKIFFHLDDHRWDACRESKERLEQVVNMAQTSALPEGFFWTDADNHDVQVSANSLNAMLAAMNVTQVRWGFKIHERQRRMKEEIALITDYDSLVNYSPGWEADATAAQ